MTRRDLAIIDPPKYNAGDFKCIEVIEDVIRFYDPSEAFAVGQVLGHVIGAPHTKNKIIDLKKAQWHLNRLIEQLDSQ